ncbi:diguanylate cyclase [Thalassiella azotivora]
MDGVARHGRRASVTMLRRDAELAAGPSAILLVYLLLTWERGPHRPLMVSLATVLVLVALAARAGARRIARGPLARVVPPWLALSHLLLFTLMAHLEGGVTSPLGVLPWTGLVLVSLVATWRRFVGYVALTGVLYWAVALSDPDVAWSRATTYTAAFVFVATVCAAHAHALRSLRTRLVDVASIDPLTGCLNRRAFDGRLGQEAARCRRTGDSFVLVLFDLDRFKEVNDTHGHAAGDALLTWTSRTLREGVRDHDPVGRLGGDEFAVLLTGTAREPAAVAAQRLRAELSQRTPSSVGWARYPADGEDVEELHRVADARLYEDKSLRDRPEVPDPVDGLTVEAPRSPRIAATERRARALAQLGWLTVGNFSFGAFYAVAFSAPAARGALLVVATVGVLAGFVTTRVAPAVVRGRHSLLASLVFSAVQGGLATAFVVVAGGVTSPTSIGLISMLPLVALSSPRRLAAPVGTTFVAVYLAVALLVGAPSGWHVFADLAAFLGMTVACGMHGHVAAGQRRRLTVLSRTDGLTGCLNRRGFEERLREALSRARRTEEPLSLLLLDLDGFKQVNDTQGHAAGDDLLRWVAQTASAGLRAGDGVGRLGGDEFAVLLPGCGADDAQVLGVRLQSALAARTGVSVGAATLGVDGADLEALYLQADRTLYAQKTSRTARRLAPVDDVRPVDDGRGPVDDGCGPGRPGQTMRATTRSGSTRRASETGAHGQRGT